MTSSIVVRRTARFTKSGHRFLLERAWGAEDAPYVLFCMLNPSTANAETDDPTIRKCMKYLRDWGFTRLRVVNLWNYVTPDPKVLRTWAVDEQVRLKNLHYDDHSLGIIDGESRYAEYTVCGWGTWGGWFPERAAQVHAVLSRPHALHVTKDGHPGHPLYLPGDVKPKPYALP